MTEEKFVEIYKLAVQNHPELRRRDAVAAEYEVLFTSQLFTDNLDAVQVALVDFQEARDIIRDAARMNARGVPNALRHAIRFSEEAKASAERARAEAARKYGTPGRVRIQRKVDEEFDRLYGKTESVAPY